MKYVKLFVAALVLATCAVGYANCDYYYATDPSVVGVDAYDFRMTVKVPRIYDNNTSQGSRKYQSQNIRGKMYIIYYYDDLTDIRIEDLVNKTHKLSNGSYVTYDCTVGENMITRVNLIGDNKKNVFKTPSVAFSLDAEPSYNLGEDDEDNSLIITLSGTGSTSSTYYYKWFDSSCWKYWKYLGTYYQIKTLSGYLAGTLGCGCRAYGHVSPTRMAGPHGASKTVDDVAAVWGTWRASYLAKESWRREDFYQQ